ncbi:MAG TPA: phage holin family protein [Pedococcus sp.]|nr:phage holin family protein [Pedococcus sp.]
MATSGNGTERTLGQLVADATQDISTIVRSEIALAKAEVTAEAKIAGKGAGMLAGAAFVGLLGLIFLFHTLANVLAVWLPLWAGYLITTVVLFLLAAILGLVGKNSMSKVKPKPERTIKNAQETIEAIKSAD